MSSEIRKILELADQSQSIQSQTHQRQKQIPPLQKLPPHPLLNAPNSQQQQFPRFIDSHIIQMKPNYPYSDYSQILQIYTPIQDPPDELRTRFQQQIQLLLPPSFPPLNEDRYYDYLCAQQLNPRVTYEQLVEIVDLAANYGFNFVVVADKIKRHALDPIVCLNAFMVYCEIQSKRKTQIDVSKTAKENYAKAMQIISYYLKTLPLYDGKCSDELDRQQTVRETWACFSPIRIAQKRFAIANSIMGKKIPFINYYDPMYVDFLGLCTDSHQKQARMRHTSYSVGQAPQSQAKTQENEQNQQLSYKQQVMRTQITFNNVPFDDNVQPDSSMTQQQAIEFAAQQIDPQQVFSQEPHPDEIDQIMKYYDSYIGKVDTIIDGFAFEVTMKLGIGQKSVPRGMLQISAEQLADLKKETFPGHYEIDFDRPDIANVCTAGSWRWCTEKIPNDNQNDAIKVFQDDEKVDQKANEAKFKKGQQLRKKLAGKEINISQFFALEELYGDGFK